ncbi:MAG: transposase [Candidatus Hydrothermarchaeota archaeon]
MSSLFRPQDLPPKVLYEKIFDQLLSLGDNTTRKRGRPSFYKDAILRALIYKNLRRLPSLSELAFELKNNPALAETLGFSAMKRHFRLIMTKKNRPCHCSKD